MSSSDSVEESGGHCRSCIGIWRQDPLRVQRSSTKKSKACRSMPFEDRLADCASWSGFPGLLLVGFLYRSGRCRMFFRVCREGIAPSSARRAAISPVRDGCMSVTQIGFVPIGSDPTDHVPNPGWISPSSLFSVPAEEIQAYPFPSGGVRYPRRVSLPSPPSPGVSPLRILPNPSYAFEDRIPQSAPQAGISSCSTLPLSLSLSHDGVDREREGGRGREGLDGVRWSEAEKRERDPPFIHIHCHQRRTRWCCRRTAAT